MELAILKQLQSLTDVEKKQKEHHVFSDDIPPTAIDLRESKTANVPVLNDYFFRNHAIYVSKHNRYAPYPLHTHQFFEMNYMLQGHADETVNGQRVHLSQGDVLLLDIGFGGINQPSRILRHRKSLRSNCLTISTNIIGTCRLKI